MRNEEALADLDQIRSKLCRGAKVSIVQCFSEFDQPSKLYGSLKARLEVFFGHGIRVETFSGNCGMKLGRPVDLSN